MLWFHLFIFKSDTPPTLLHTLSFPNTFEGHGYCGFGGEQNRPAPKGDPCSIFFFLGVDLDFLRGAGLVGSVFLRDEGVVGSVF